jgi:hypothetical protein
MAEKNFIKGEDGMPKKLLNIPEFNVKKWLYYCFS